MNRILHGEVMNAMDSVSRFAAMQRLWGGQFEDLLNYLALATPATRYGLDLLRHDVQQKPQCSTVVITGERCTGTKDDGSDSPILLGVAKVAEILAPVSCMESLARNGREPNALTILFSGGVKYVTAVGEYPADVLAAQFNALTHNQYASAVAFETASLNTGDQARILAGMLYTRRPKRVVFAHVKDHVARLAATVTYALRQMIKAENYRLCLMGEGLILDDGPANVALRGRFTAARREMPEILIVAIGEWSDRDVRRDKGSGISRAQEAFGEIQTAEEAVVLGKHLGGEYGERYYQEQHRYNNIGFSCPAHTPAEMVDILPRWVKERMGYFRAQNLG